jgi:ABC-2 type transport system ATP-binding protein
MNQSDLPPGSECCLQLSGLSKHYANVLALKNLDLAIAPGEIFGYLGPNGAGKTPTLRLILGLIQPTAGEVIMFGERVVPCSSRSVVLRERVGYVPGELNLYGDMTGQELLAHFARFRPRQSKPPALQTRLLEAFALDPATLQRRIKLLSHGTRQKIGLVLALQHQPRLLLLDEPTLGLDPLMQRAFAEIMREQARQGTAIFFSSHILSEVDQLCQRVGILRNGELIAMESIAALRRKLVRRMTIRFAQTPPSFKQIPSVLTSETCGQQVSLSVQGDLNALLRYLAGYPLEHFTFPEAELEDVFAHYYSAGNHQSVAPRA